MANHQGEGGKDNRHQMPPRQVVGASQPVVAEGGGLDSTEEMTLSDHMVMDEILDTPPPRRPDPPERQTPPPARPMAAPRAAPPPRPPQAPLRSNVVVGAKPAAQATTNGPAASETGPDSLKGDPTNGPMVPGARIGNYRIVQKIGEGAMAAIFLAKDVSRGRNVALKALHRKQTQGLAARRFKREFRALSRISHPNIVRVFEYGNFQDQPYFVMEYVPGRDLKALLPELRNMAPAVRYGEIEAIVVQVCRALDAIHSRGIVHRDLKPSNILLTEHRQVKLTDFGVAKPEVTKEALTRENTLVGTLTYLAPEAFERGEFSFRIDLYALGVMLYNMLTGRLPFMGKNVAQLMHKHLNEEVTPPRELDPTVPEHLEAMCLKLMAKDPNFRHQSAAEVIRELTLGSRKLVPRPIGIEEGGSAAAGTENLWLPRMVGRREVLHTVYEAVATLKEGRGGLMVIEGNTGVGKTRVAEALLTHAREQGLGVHRGKCLSGGRGWFEGLKGLVASSTTEVDACGDSRLHKLYERAVAAVGGLEGPPPEKEGDGPVLNPPTEAPAADFFDMLRQRQASNQPQGPSSILEAFFKALVREAPRILFIDDLEGADTGTLAILGTLVRNIAASSPMLVVVGVRLAEGNPSPGVRALLTGERTGIVPRYLGLGPLARWDVMELLEDMFPDDPRLPQLTELLHRRTGGLPLALVETVRLLMQSGYISPRAVDEQGHYKLNIRPEDMTPEKLKLPAGVPSLLQARLRPHAAATRTLLKLIAAWERDVSLEQLLRVTGAQEELILSHLDKLLGEGILVERWLGRRERYDCAHSTYREAVLATLTPEEWNGLKAAVARETSSNPT